MVTQHACCEVCMCEVEKRSFLKKNPICDCSRSRQMPSTDQITEKLPLTCAPIFELPSNISTMDKKDAHNRDKLV